MLGSEGRVMFTVYYVHRDHIDVCSARVHTAIQLARMILFLEGEGFQVTSVQSD